MCKSVTWVQVVEPRLLLEVALPQEEKREEKKDESEESDDDMGFGLFDGAVFFSYIQNK
ncbi:hypothetical protein SKAU_G00217970 [Synaphobranchus kaupii]|uniref:Uncharacterized protein n=1 Tax=Synaphobranchus kaupii TaxID=118154 RepID=A0A9Q1FAE9_SYNKA|nr:hypothetical protein SKAU_G00217970 [Synaphobranchus kaupii]